METISILFKRNIKLFFRDKTAVFFSVFSALIVIFLYLLFIAQMYITGMTEAGIPLADKEMNFMIYNLVFASAIVLNSISIPTCALTIMTRDFETNKTDSLLLAPVKPMQLLLSYFSAAFAVTAAINGATWVLGTVIVGAATGIFLSAGTMVLGLVIAIMISLVSSMIMSLIVTVVKSTAALNVVGGVAGTFFGFLCGIYMPYSTLGNGMKTVGSIFPFTHLTIWFKKIVLDNAFAKFGLDNSFYDALYSESFSASNIGFLGLGIPLWAMLLISGIFGMGCLILAAFLLKKRIVKR